MPYFEGVYVAHLSIFVLLVYVLCVVLYVACVSGLAILEWFSLTFIS